MMSDYILKCIADKLDQLIACQGCAPGAPPPPTGADCNDAIHTKECRGTTADPLVVDLGALGSPTSPLTVSLGTFGADCTTPFHTKECRGTTADPLVVDLGTLGSPAAPMTVTLGSLGASCNDPLHVTTCPPTAATIAATTAALPKRKSVFFNAATATIPAGVLSWAVANCDGAAYTANGTPICAGVVMDNHDSTFMGTSVQTCEAITFIASAGTMVGHYDLWC